MFIDMMITPLDKGANRSGSSVENRNAILFDQSPEASSSGQLGAPSYINTVAPADSGP